MKTIAAVDTMLSDIHNISSSYCLGKGEGTSTGIRYIVTRASNQIYNLNGQRLNGLCKGLNIVDGRKVVIK